MPAATAPNSIIDSAMRLMDVRQSTSIRKNSAEMIVPPEAIAIHHT